MSNELISVLALLVAACAMAATFWQAHLAREHNRLCVRPFLALQRKWIESDEGTELVLTLMNNGVGPAIVMDRYFTVDSERFTPTSDDPVRELVHRLIQHRFQYQLKQHGLPGIGTPIPAGQHQSIAHVLLPGASRTMADCYLEQISDVGFHVEYQSLYREKLTLTAT